MTSCNFVHCYILFMNKFMKIENPIVLCVVTLTPRQGQLGPVDDLLVATEEDLGTVACAASLMPPCRRSIGGWVCVEVRYSTKVSQDVTLTSAGWVCVELRCSMKVSQDVTLTPPYTLRRKWDWYSIDRLFFSFQRPQGDKRHLVLGSSQLRCPR